MSEQLRGTVSSNSRFQTVLIISTVFRQPLIRPTSPRSFKAVPLLWAERLPRTRLCVSVCVCVRAPRRQPCSHPWLNHLMCVHVCVYVHVYVYVYVCVYVYVYVCVYALIMFDAVLFVRMYGASALGEEPPGSG